MRRWNVATGLFSVGLILSACSSGSDSTGTGGSGGGAGHHTGGSGGAVHTGGSGGAIHTGGAGGGAAGAPGTAGAAGGSAGAGGASTGGQAGGGTSGGGVSGGGAGGKAGAAGGGSGTAGSAGGAGGKAGAAGGGSGTAGSAGGTAGSASGTAGSAGGAAGSAGGAVAGGAGGPALTTQEMRGQYLVNSVLGCQGCHTPQNGAPLSGVDCFVKTAPSTTGSAGAGGNGAAGAGGGNGGAGGASGPCLSSANLTNDASGIKNLTDQQVKDAFTMGKDPDEANKYLFANMPYYQFANLSDADANAIVAYLRTVPGVAHTVQAARPPYDVQPSAPEWAPVDPNALPAASSTTGAANGKYLATLTCVTCHTVTASGSPLHIDATKAFQGGKIVNATVAGTPKSVQTSNLTPAATGIMGWTAAQVAHAITAAVDNTNTPICGMRALGGMTTSDATDIGTYLLGIPPVTNSITMTCQ
jgi:hypothetical protein